MKHPNLPNRFRFRRVFGFVSYVVAFGVVGLARGDSPPADKAPHLSGVSTNADAAAEKSTTAKDELDNLLNLDIGQLSRVEVSTPSLNMEVMSVSRTETSVGKSPAAIFVITNEMIRRSTARSLPEVFRMVPGMQVARLNGNKWSVGIRGLGGIFSSKLLVQIDGRSVYTPIFGGVYWDAQDVLLEDVERIEIIRGPGATVWGANAVNGIINIVTKHTSDTQGVFVEGGAGTEESGFASARIGGTVGQTGHYRAWVKWFNRDAGALPNDVPPDTSEMGRGGFRMDWAQSDFDALTFQGDFYGAVSGTRSEFPSLAPPYSTQTDFDALPSGGNLLSRWTRTYDEFEEFSVQAYVDRAERHWAGPELRLNRDTVDVDFQHRFPLGYNHSIIWGAGYRNNRLKVVDAPFSGTTPLVGSSIPNRAVDNFSYFIQDTFTLEEDRWFLTAGSKFSHNDFSGFEYQPTVRLLWTPTKKQSIWGAVSRAVRTPTFADNQMRATQLPISTPPGPLIFPFATGNESFVSEELLAMEIGMRAQPVKEFFWDVAGYYFRYDNLLALMPGPFTPGTPPTFLLMPVTFTNGAQATSYGFEIAGTYEINPGWRLQGHYSFNRVTYDELAGSTSVGEDRGSYPRNQTYFRSSWDLGNDVELDVIWRFVDQLRTFGVPSYNTADIRLAWQPRDGLEVALVARNLFDRAHPELPNDTNLGVVATQVERGFYGVVTWRY